MIKVILRFAAKNEVGIYVESKRKFEFWGVPYFTGDIIEVLNYNPEPYPQQAPFKFYPKTGDRFRIKAWMCQRLYSCLGGQQYDDAIKDPENFYAELAIESGREWFFKDKQIMLYRRPFWNWVKLILFHITKRHR